MIVALAGFFKLRDWRRRDYSHNRAASGGLEIDLERGSQENQGRRSSKQDGEQVQHLAVLSRIGSRLSDTPMLGPRPR